MKFTGALLFAEKKVILEVKDETLRICHVMLCYVYHVHLNL
jgi:hypothetical protein